MHIQLVDPEYAHSCVFYGDLYPNDECFDPRVASGLCVLMEARKKYAYGECTNYFHSWNCIGFVRAGDVSHRGCAVLLSNANPTPGYVLSDESAMALTACVLAPMMQCIACA